MPAEATGCVTVEDSELREAKSFIMGSKYACSLLWKETLYYIRQ